MMTMQFQLLKCKFVGSACVVSTTIYVYARIKLHVGIRMFNA